MRVKFRKEQFDAAVDFILTRNPNSFTVSQIEESILGSIDRFAEDEDIQWTGTMGYTVIIGDDVKDDDSERTVYVEILVDPALMDDRFTWSVR